jgi:hypothetical protein
MVQDLAAPVDAPWAAYEWRQADQRVAEDEAVVADLTRECHGTRTVAPRREPCARGTFPNTGA